jgi:hypothetical protein
VEGGLQAPYYDYLAGLLRSLLPQTERLGVATAAEIGVDTVAERLWDEACASRMSHGTAAHRRLVAHSCVT